MTIIDKAYKKIKTLFAYSYIDEIIWVAIIMFISLGSFSFGVIYERNQYLERNPITIEYSNEAVELWNEYQNNKFESQNFFASKSGSIIYPIDCPAGKRVKEENRIYFSSLEQGLAEGYRETNSC